MDLNFFALKLIRNIFSRNNETFRVIVVMPLLPAFEGELGTATGGALHTITYYNYASMCR